MMIRNLNKFKKESGSDEIVSEDNIVLHKDGSHVVIKKTKKTKLKGEKFKKGRQAKLEKQKKAENSKRNQKNKKDIKTNLKNNEIHIHKRPRIFGASKAKLQIIHSLSLMVRAGVSVDQALDGIKEEMPSRVIRDVLDNMIKDIRDGYTLAQSFARTGLYDRRVITLMEVGEEGGNLAKNLAVIANNEKKNSELVSRIRSAMMYPLFIMFVMLVVGIGVIWYALPKLVTVFEQMKLELPPLTQALLDIGGFLQSYGIIAVPVFFIILGVGIHLLFLNKKTKHVGHSILFLVPVIKDLMRDIEISRFGFLLGSLLEAGMPMLEALESMEGSYMFKRYGDLYTHLSTSILEGYSFHQSMKKYKGINKLFPATTQRIIYAGEETGTITKSFYEVGKSAELRTENETKNLSVMVEPLLLLMVWGGVIFLAVGVMMPIYQLVGDFEM